MEQPTDQRLAGQVAVITGAGTATADGMGNGQAMALTFARHGAAVVCVDRVGERAEAVVSKITEEGGRAIAVEADVTRVEDCDRVTAHADAEFGQVDALVNSAGVVSRHGMAAPGSPEGCSANWRSSTSTTGIWSSGSTSLGPCSPPGPWRPPSPAKAARWSTSGPPWPATGMGTAAWPTACRRRRSRD